MQAHQRFVVAEPRSTPTAEELVMKALDNAHCFLGHCPYTALLGCMAEIGVFDKELRESAFRLLKKQYGGSAESAKITAPSKIKSHASCSAEALARIEENAPVILGGN